MKKLIQLLLKSTAIFLFAVLAFAPAARAAVSVVATKSSGLNINGWTTGGTTLTWNDASFTIPSGGIAGKLLVMVTGEGAATSLNITWNATPLTLQRGGFSGAAYAFVYALDNPAPGTGPLIVVGPGGNRYGVTAIYATGVLGLESSDAKSGTVPVLTAGPITPTVGALVVSAGGHGANAFPNPPPAAYTGPGMTGGTLLMNLTGLGSGGAVDYLIAPDSTPLSATYYQGTDGQGEGVVIASFEPKDPARIKTFGIPGSPAVIGATSIAWTVPWNPWGISGLATLAPTITLSSGTCVPASGVAPNFAVNNPATYTVTDGADVNVYTVTVSVTPISSAKDFLTFGPGGTVDTGAQTVGWSVPPAPSVTRLAPTYTLSPYASCVPASGATVDFSTPQTYTITAQDGSTKTYTVTVTVLPFFIASKALNVTAAATGAEILNDAVLIEANHYGREAAAPVTLVNGLTFGIDPAHLLPTPYWGSEGQRTSTDGQNLVTALTSATAYGTLMRGYNWCSTSTSATTSFLNIPGLTPDHVYRLQLISSSSRNALVYVEANDPWTWTGTAPSLMTVIWTQGAGDTEANVGFRRGSNELLINGYALHDMSLLPFVPTGLAPIPLIGNIVLNWTRAEGAASYKVKRSLTPGGPYLEANVIATPTALTYTDSAVANGVTYYYVVSAVNGAGESANSAEVSATPAVVKLDQTITFALGLTVDKTTTNTPFADLAMATSTLPVTYSVHPADVAIASVDPITGLVTLNRVPGTARIRANQAGNSGYNPAPEVTQVLTVTQVLPVLSWRDPRAIAVGTLLSATELNATCTVPGTFTYAPDIGALLALGSHTLSVHFAPAEPIPFSTPEDKTVTITVGSPDGPTVINVNYGLQANSAMNGYYSFDPTARGSASQPAPAPYGGNTWNDFGGDTGSLDLLDSKGASTGVGFSWGPGANSSPYNDWNGLGFNRMLISGRFLNSATYAAIFTLTGLKVGHKYDLYIASLHNTERNSIDFQAVGAATAELHCAYISATDWVAGENYVRFTDVEPAPDGSLVVNAQRPGGGYLNGFQLQDVGVTAPLLASISPPVGGDVTVTFNTVVGLCYKVEYTDAFSSTSAPSWSEVVPGVQKATGTTMSVVDLGASGSSPQRFYRVVQVTCPP